ncbi:MAG: bifunctional phosphoribosylaminoimidazolecarboxamide formyltransferase/IMP cyclohydrolase [Alphaproteobacteria bacterium]
MVTRKNLKSNALISVYDKSSLKQLCATLDRHNIGIISTGGTAKKIKELGFKCTQLSSLTHFKEILDGRVKSLHPKIHASILFKRNNINHEKTFKKLNFPKIDFLIVNFYPFSKINAKKNKEKKIDMIDIGGPSMIRSASKNFNSVTTVCEKKYYGSLIKELNKNNGETTLDFRQRMASHNFKITSSYDLSIFNWLSKKKKENSSKKIKVKYGENHYQKAFFVKNSDPNIINSQISGKEIGYNNILDISEGLNCLNEFDEPTCVIVKHNNPCGVASGNSIKTAYLKALRSDPISCFGGVMLLNKNIDVNLAKIINNNFFEVIVAPSFTSKTTNILKDKKKLILIQSKGLKNSNKLLFKSVNSGVLYQEENTLIIKKSNLNLVTRKKISEKKIEDLLFALKVAKHVKSNAIVFAKNKQTVGIGAGQMSRLDATRLAIMKHKDFFRNKNFVCASDAFFPFTDNLKILHRNGCQAIVQPSGSINDNKVIQFAEKNNLPLFFYKYRVFKH